MKVLLEMRDLATKKTFRGPANSKESQPKTVTVPSGIRADEPANENHSSCGTFFACGGARASGERVGMRSTRKECDLGGHLLAGLPPMEDGKQT